MNRETACVISPAFIKICCVGTIVTWSCILIVGVLLAQLDPSGPNFDPAGFNPLIDYLSNMGSIHYTPFPFIFNFGITFIALLMIPVTFYLKKLMIGDNSCVIRKILALLFTVLMVTGFIFLILVGWINQELSKTWEQQFSYPLNACNWHFTLASISFSCIILGGGVFTLFSLIFLNFLREKLLIQNPIRGKILLVVNYFILTPIFLTLFTSCPLLHSEDLFWKTLPIWKWATFWEWLFAISMTIGMFFVCISLFRPLNAKLRKP